MAKAQGRKLVAIMFTDMVGFTALTQQNEPLSLELLEAHQRLLRPIFVKHHGREIKTIGDAFHIEFASALEAVRCAIDIQKALIEHNASSPPEKKVQIRIGIHLGDVTPRAQDIFGDAVNIASRIEPLAEPGGVCISQQVYDQVQNKLDTPLVSLGKRDLKNVAVPLEVYRVVLPWEKGALAGAATVTGHRRIKRLRLAALVGVPAVLLVAFSLWWFASPYFVNRVPKASPTVATPNEPPSIAVLPFDNLSNDPNNEYFSDGMTDELIDSLSQLPNLKVIARTSVFTYKGKPQDVRQIGLQLNVRTILEGSAQKDGDTVRLRVQLIDATDGTQLWSQSYDRQMKDVFAIQDEISQAIVTTLKIKLLGDQKTTLARNSTGNPKAYELYLRGHFLCSSASSDEDYKKSIDYLEQAIKEDPNYAPAYATLALCYSWASGFSSFPEKEADPKTLAAVRKALELDDRLAEAHAVLADLIWFGSNQTEQYGLMAEREYKRAIELNPNSATARREYAIYLFNAKGLSEEGLTEMKRAGELDPLSSDISLGLVAMYYWTRQYDQAIEQALKALELSPNDADMHYFLGQVYLAKGMYEKALAEFQMAQQLYAGSYVTDVLSLIGYTYAKMGKRDEAQKVLDEVMRRQTKPEDDSTYAYDVIESVSSDILILYLGLGDTDQFFKWFKALTLTSWAGSPGYEFKRSAIWDSARSDPRFSTMISLLEVEHKVKELYYTRQYDRVIEESQKIVQLDPSYPDAYWWPARAYLQLSRYEEALASLQKLMDTEKGLGIEEAKWYILSYVGYGYAKLGKRGEAEKIIEELKQNAKPGHGAPYHIAIVYLGLNELDQVFAWLNQGWDESSNAPYLLKGEPIWDSIRSDPRFVTLMQKAGLDWP